MQSTAVADKEVESFGATTAADLAGEKMMRLVFYFEVLLLHLIKVSPLQTWQTLQSLPNGLQLLR